MTAADRVLDAPLQTADGVPTTLRAWLGPRATVVVFLRHFGWLFCRERAAQLRGREGELRAADARLVFVGTGSPAMARDFAATHAGPFPVLSDVKKGAYVAAGMQRSASAMLHPRLLVNLWRALRRGHRQGRVQGDAFQQGGALVFGPGGRLLHQQTDATSGDPLDLGAIVAAAAQ